MDTPPVVAVITVDKTMDTTACHSLQEVFRNLTGIVVPQSTIASVAGTNQLTELTMMD